MNRAKKLKQMRRFIYKYGVIDNEYKQPPSKYFPPYRKGSYFISFLTDTSEHAVSIIVTDSNKYLAYKSMVNEIKELLDKC